MKWLSVNNYVKNYLLDRYYYYAWTEIGDFKDENCITVSRRFQWALTVRTDYVVVASSREEFYFHARQWPETHCIKARLVQTFVWSHVLRWG